MTAAAILLAAAALLSALRIVAARARAPRLPPAPPAAGSVLALLPVRDEEENVEACLHSLLAQTAQLRVRVLDDSSHDRTRALAEEVARHDERVEVRDVPVPQAGLNGKVHALAHGSQGATEDWIVAIDADARLAPTALARALAAADRHGLAAVSLAARQRARGIGEAMLTPAGTPPWAGARRSPTASSCSFDDTPCVRSAATPRSGASRSTTSRWPGGWRRTVSRSASGAPVRCSKCGCTGAAAPPFAAGAAISV